jgi:RelA/SpoT family (p)ppGpp synthetase
MVKQNSQIEKLIKNKQDPKLILEAFEFAKEIYKNRKRLNGENYIEHVMRVALFLDKMGLDEKTIIIAILHDVIDEKPLSMQETELKEIAKIFDQEIADLIKKVSDLRKIRFPLETKIKERKTFTKEKIENLRKTFIALAGDLRVILIELVSRLDGLEHLGTLPEEQRKMYSLETLEIFVPIANRLGLGEIKRLLEDGSFFYLFGDKYKWIQNNTKEKYEERERYIRKFIPKLSKILKKERIKFSEINYRAKSYWSTYRKLLRKDMDIEKIHDLVAVRIITDNVEDCYKALGTVHKYFKPISEEIDDYIAKPKINGYRSLHTSVFLDKEHISEIQIRTKEMHKEAEYGVCAHWSYKEKIDLTKDNKKFAWVTQIPKVEETFKIDFFVDQIFAFTPKGDIISLPKGSCPVDFAYAVHSDIGNHCESAKILGKIVPLSYALENADVVEIIVNKNRLPSQDWLKFVKTNMAKGHIKKFSLQKTSGFSFVIPNFIKNKVLEITEKFQKRKEEKQKIIKERPQHISIAGQKGMLVNIAKCCNPKPKDQVKAFITKFRAIVLHKTSCKNFQRLAEKFPDKVIDANWE